jgi:endonuclease YncB( thermonuclease family)
VVGVADGDTITVLHDEKQAKIRLYGIDCPERGQAFGKKAKQFTSNMVFQKTVSVEEITRDRYGRTVALVYLDDKSLNEALIRAGLAWMYHRYCEEPICWKWRNLETEANRAKVGLWSDPNPIPPWEFRRKGRK